MAENITLTVNHIPRNIEVVFDHDTKTFVAAIRGGRYHRMMSGNMRQMVVATGEAEEAEEAVARAVAELKDTYGSMCDCGCRRSFRVS